MLEYFNQDGIMYTILSGLVSDVTGSMFLTLLLIIALIIVFALMFRIPLEFTVLFVFPLITAFFVYGGMAFGSVFGLSLLYLSVLFAKNFFFWR